MERLQTHTDLRWEKFAGFGGVLFGALTFVILLLDSYPADDAPAADWLAYLVGDTTAKLVYAILLGVAFFAFLWCFGSVRSILAKAEGTPQRLSTLSFGAAVAAVALIAGSVAFTWSFGIAESYLGAFEGDAQTGLALVGAGAIFFAYASMAAGMAVGVSGIAMLRTNTFPRWFGWASVLSGLVIITGGIFDYVFLLLLLWAAVVGVLIMGGIGTTPKVPDTPESLLGKEQETGSKTG